MRPSTNPAPSCARPRPFSLEGVDVEALLRWERQPRSEVGQTRDLGLRLCPAGADGAGQTGSDGGQTDGTAGTGGARERGA